MAEDAVVYRADHAVITNDTFPDGPDLPRGCCCRGTYP